MANQTWLPADVGPADVCVQKSSWEHWVRYLLVPGQLVAYLYT